MFFANFVSYLPFLECPPGHYYSPLDAACFPCRAGHYYDETYRTCISCVPPMTSTEPGGHGASSCTSMHIKLNVFIFGKHCPALLLLKGTPFWWLYEGYSYIHSLLFLFVECRKGYYNYYGECVSCPKGSYSEIIDAPYCTRCPEGQTTDSHSADSISLCRGRSIP